MRKNRLERPATDINYLSGFMLGLREDQGRLREIQSVYDNLTLLGQLLCAGTDITQMRADFKELADVLMTQLAQELRKKAVLGLRSDARVAIDILVRNLFERTADIGFLATDSEIRAFAEIAGSDPAAAAEQRPALRARFDEYVRKYSVYHDIILLAPDGKVLARLDEEIPLAASRDPLIAESLATEAAYVETFRASDLLPGESSPLIYSYRVMAADGSRPVGVLCLCFRFQDECARIFRSLLEEDEWTVITFLSPEGKVIASSDPYQFPVGARLAGGDDEECRIARFAGREYLASTCQSHGYQGYRGPGWRGHALAPLNHAFEMSLAGELDEVPESVRAGVLETATLFSAELRDIPLRAASIQRELNRAVWNGNVWLSRDSHALNTAFAKVLLWEIGSTGMKTRSVFSESTTNLYETVVSAALSDCSAQAALAMDIMDRNLYERANDCRWWALTGAFREALAQGGTARREELTAILRSINGLYTVYANLLIFDGAGQVVAVANPAYNDMLGQTLQAEWMRKTLALPDSQSYCVSPFAPSPLYANLPTYIYAAAIRAPGERGDPVGGIAIIFDSATQFAAMLEDALPRTEGGAIVDGAFALFTDQEGRVIASTDPELASGMRLEIGREFFALEPGGEYANIVEFRGRYFAVGARMSAGYREYKSASDAYRNAVVALVLVPLSDRVLRPDEQRLLQRADKASYARRQAGGEDAVEIATFYIGDSWYGVASSLVVEAIDAGDITVIPGLPESARGCVMHDDQPITIFDLAALLTGRPTAVEARQIVVIRSLEQRISFGILVDELGEIPEIAAERIEPIPGMLANGKSLTESLVKPHPADADKRILVILSVERMLQRLFGARLQHEAPLTLAYREA
ncbi:MAG: chemotaxis protein CheW [Dechloromonas sp.]|nr:chemotaxis protein CheW [Dechloromonas sp.]